MIGTLLTGLEVGPWFLAGSSVTGLTSMFIGAWLLIRALHWSQEFGEMRDLTAFLVY